MNSLLFFKILTYALSGYRLTTKQQTDNVTLVWETLPITEKGKDEINFAALSPGVKINQFPGLYVIGRKDYLWTSYLKMQQKYGKEYFDFLAQTYVLPEDMEECKAAMKLSNKVMIVKPPNYYCGIGIKLINKTGDLYFRYFTRTLSMTFWSFV